MALTLLSFCLLKTAKSRGSGMSEISCLRLFDDYREDRTVFPQYTRNDRIRISCTLKIRHEDFPLYGLRTIKQVAIA